MSDAHFRMASDDWAGDAKRRVPILHTQAKNRRFFKCPERVLYRAGGCLLGKQWLATKCSPESYS